MSFNPDALCITPAHGKVVPAWTDPKPLHAYYEQGRLDTKLHHGNKPINSNGLKRMREFCASAFDEIDKDSMVVAGHSLWFRSFFRRYLPRDFDHVSKKKKLVNGGIVGFKLERIRKGDGGDGDGEKSSWAYRIDPKSIVVLYGGF